MARTAAKKAAPKPYRPAATRLGKRALQVYVDEPLLRVFRGATIMQGTTINAVFDRLAREWCAAHGVEIPDA